MKLNDRTTIILWDALIAAAVVVGFVFWLATVANLGEATAKTVDKLESVIYKMRDDISYIRAKLEKEDKNRNKNND